jgi:hypothetical protein
MKYWNKQRKENATAQIQQTHNNNEPVPNMSS